MTCCVFKSINNIPSRFNLSIKNEQADAGRDRRPNPSRDTKFSGANGARDIFVFPVQLTTIRITGNLTRSIIYSANICDDYTYIYTLIMKACLWLTSTKQACLHILGHGSVDVTNVNC